jgi:simple sugar transport system ATP-binding protein
MSRPNYSVPLLELKGIRKEFPGVVALDDVDFAVEEGEIRALMGENGAGKSTLIKVLTGVYAPDAGNIVFEGLGIRPRSTAHAQELGISTVYQEVNLVPNLSVAENICLGSEPRSFGRIDWRAMRTRARTALQRMNLQLDVAQPLSSFSTALQQMIAIARALDRDAKVLVLDEPTSSLDRDECERLFALMRDLRGRGMAIVFVTHFLDQVYAIADTITVLRNGRLVGNWKSADLSRHALVSEMIGRNLEEVGRTGHFDQTGGVLVAADGLGRKRSVEPTTFDVRKGEVVALSGLLGSGRTETMRLVFGADPADSGTIAMDGTIVSIKSPADAVRARMGFCSEDRKLEGICPGLSIRENVLLVLQARRGWHRAIPKARQREIVDDFIGRLQIKTPDSERPIENLSGGNQQKALLARWLAADPRFLILDEPTRGIDVGSKLEIRTLIRELAGQGMGFLFTSSELEEVVHTADRVVVLRDRRKVGELSGTEVTEAKIMGIIAQGDGE